MAKRNKDRDVKLRNPYATPARMRNGAGNHGDARKERSRKACRGRYRGDG